MSRSAILLFLAVCLLVPTTALTQGQPSSLACVRSADDTASHCLHEAR